MDLKYRETLPGTIRDVVITISEDESAPRKKRRSKKKKLGRNGLYPEEDGYVRRWWKDRSSEQGESMETSREAQTKKHVGDLRLRETQLQILLILEAISLEVAVAEEAKAKESQDAADAKKSKPKKPQDLHVLLELHLDRLCIWHAVSAEEATVPDSAKADNPLSGKKAESDVVRDFCTEVIIPFYAARLPDKCKIITRKFGVSGAISPQTKHSKRAPRAQPGTAVRREQPQKSRRTLHRVLTDEQSTSQSRPSLHRSNTTPTYPDSKRESMEPLLPMLNASVRGGIQKAKRAENRQVDLNAAARQSETKLKKVQLLADQKKELDAAIHALRKPNRELVAKDIAEDADKRKTTGGGASGVGSRGGSARKQMNPVRNPMGQGVQVMATPKGERKKDMVVGLPPLPKDFVRSSSSRRNGSSPFGSETQVVPGSVGRPAATATSIPGGSHGAWGIRGGSDTGQDVGAAGVQETPTRRPPQPTLAPAPVETSSPVQVKTTGNLFRVPSRPAPRPSDAVPCTPVSARKTDIPFSTRPRSNPFDLPQRQPRSTVVTDTLPKLSAQIQLPKAPVSKTEAAGTGTRTGTGSGVPVTPEKSIYDQLGWDDDELAL